MRPPRLLILLSCFVALPIFLTFFSLLHAHPRNRVATDSASTTERTGIRALFSFHTPTSLFSPSAIISLTDDNSTFFLARPAYFGPILPSSGLSGQLWVGSGFGDDGLRRGGVTTGAEGELGCSDVPGWGDGLKHSHGDKSIESSSKGKAAAQSHGKSHNEEDVDEKQRRSDNIEGSSSQEEKIASPPPNEDDGTDDHLHHPLPGSQVVKPGKPGQPAEHESVKDGNPPQHADIQSLQESAEIAGKVVLLSRGGCGFLEKVKWAQRRGAMAVIVGDDTRGGGLITMYARGDTSNVTIPSVFTSHTTAHLLSSLIPPGGDLDDVGLEDGTKVSSNEERQGKAGAKKKGPKKNKPANDGPTFTPTTGHLKPTGSIRPTTLPGVSRRSSSKTNFVPNQSQKRSSWLGSVASAFGIKRDSVSSGLPADSRRPPSSGRINWIISDTWNDEAVDEKQAKGKPVPTNKGNNRAGSAQDSGDGFVIGVQDWRDPDLVGPPGSKTNSGKSKTKADRLASKPSSSTVSPASKNTELSQQKNGKTLSGGSITPGSGEYEKPVHGSDGSEKSSQNGKDTSKANVGEQHNENEKYWLSDMFWGSKSEDVKTHLDAAHREGQGSDDTKVSAHRLQELILEDFDEESDGSADHEGLWITLTPTTMSTNPFFDTLLVLVVSPLVTLTVVYALLLLRSRIRRRRWRAPKSVVDRLPIRTYQTMSCSSTSTSSQITSPVGSSPTSPLLQTGTRPSKNRSRPRSQTTSQLGEAVSMPLDQASGASSAAPKRYNGKQIECVVCLEEYVSGQSRVMSLPCGHEFHAECM